MPCTVSIGNPSACVRAADAASGGLAAAQRLCRVVQRGQPRPQGGEHPTVAIGPNSWPKVQRSARARRTTLPPTPPPRTRSAPGSWRSSGLLPLHLHRRRSRGEANTSTDYPPPLLLRRAGTPSAVDAFLAAGAPRVPPAAHPSSPPPPGQHARVVGRVSVIPPNAAPSSMRLLVALIYAVCQCTSSSCSAPRKRHSPVPPDTRV